GRQPVSGKNPSPGRAGRRHPQVLAAPPQTAVLDHPHHEPRPSRPDPAFGQLRPMMEKAHWDRTVRSAKPGTDLDGDGRADAKITLTPPSAGAQRLYVRSLDAAQNRSDRASY